MYSWLRAGAGACSCAWEPELKGACVYGCVLDRCTRNYAHENAHSAVLHMGWCTGVVHSRAAQAAWQVRECQDETAVGFMRCIQLVY